MLLKSPGSTPGIGVPNNSSRSTMVAHPADNRSTKVQLFPRGPNINTVMKINELISDTDTNNLNSQGYSVVDQFETEGYNFALTKIPDMMAPMIGAEYQLGFSKDGTDFTDYAQHDQKFVKQDEKFPLGALGKGLDTVKEWCSTYGPIVIASSNPQKTRIYSRVFKRAKFDIESNSAMGMDWLIIS